MGCGDVRLLRTIGGVDFTRQERATLNKLTMPMEALAGARDDRHLMSLRRLLARATVLPAGPVDYEDAAALYRVCRREGETVRRLIDCLIGAVSIRADVPILHNDADFGVLARHTDLKRAE